MNQEKVDPGVLGTGNESGRGRARQTQECCKRKECV